MHKYKYKYKYNKSCAADKNIDTKMVSNPKTYREKGSGQLGHVKQSELLYQRQCEFQTGYQTGEQPSQLPARPESHFKSSCLHCIQRQACKHFLYVSFTLYIVVYMLVLEASVLFK